MRFWTRLSGYSAAVEARFGPLGGHVRTAEGPIHYLADGPARGVPVVLLHGASGNLRDWALSVMPALARRHRVIAFDRPGFGHSAPVADAAALGAQARALSAALGQLGARRYALVGHSYGGALAMAWALAEPEAVAGVTLVGAPVMDWGGGLGPLYRYGAAPVLGGLLSRAAPVITRPGMIDAALASIFAPQPVPARYRAESGAELALRPRTFRINTRAVATLHRQILEMAPRYPTLGVPVEIVHGAEDRIVPASIHALGLKRVLPRASLTLLAGVGHMPHHAEPGAVVAAVERMMRRAEARAREGAPGG